MNTEISIEKYVPKKYRHCVDEFFKDIDGCWLFLKEGYISAYTEGTSLHEDSINEIRKQFKTIMLESDFDKLTRNKVTEVIKNGNKKGL